MALTLHFLSSVFYSKTASLQQLSPDYWMSCALSALNGEVKAQEKHTSAVSLLCQL